MGESRATVESVPAGTFYCLPLPTPENTLLSGMTSELLRIVTKSCLTLCNPTNYSPPGCPWDSPGKNTGVGCHFLLQGVFPTQESNPCLLHWQADSLPRNHQGSPDSKNIMLSFSTTVFIFSNIYQAFATHISLLVLGNFKSQGAESNSEYLRQEGGWVD